MVSYKIDDLEWNCLNSILVEMELQQCYTEPWTAISIRYMMAKPCIDNETSKKKVIEIVLLISNHLYLQTCVILYKICKNFYPRPQSAPTGIVVSHCICPSICPSVCLSIPNDVTALTLYGFQVSAWNLVGWCTVPWSRSLFKMAMLGQFLRIPRNFEISRTG